MESESAEAVAAAARAPISHGLTWSRGPTTCRGRAGIQNQNGSSARPQLAAAWACGPCPSCVRGRGWGSCPSPSPRPGPHRSLRRQWRRPRHALPLAAVGAGVLGSDVSRSQSGDRGPRLWSVSESKFDSVSGADPRSGIRRRAASESMSAFRAELRSEPLFVSAPESAGGGSGTCGQERSPGSGSVPSPCPCQTLCPRPSPDLGSVSESASLSRVEPRSEPLPEPVSESASAAAAGARAAITRRSSFKSVPVGVSVGVSVVGVRVRGRIWGLYTSPCLCPVRSERLSVSEPETASAEAGARAHAHHSQSASSDLCLWFGPRPTLGPRPSPDLGSVSESVSVSVSRVELQFQSESASAAAGARAAISRNPSFRVRARGRGWGLRLSPGLGVHIRVRGWGPRQSRGLGSASETESGIEVHV